MDMQRIISKHQHTDGLIALFPQHQMSGNISYDFGPNQGHGVLSNVASRYSDHSVSPGHFMNASGYDPKSSSYNNILTAALIAAFDGNTFSIVVFCKTDAAWGEGIERWALRLQTDDGDEIEFSKQVAADTFMVRYDPSSGHNVQLTITTMDWFCVGLTVDNPVTDRAEIYVDGIDVDSLVTFPAWSGTLDLALIGAETAEPVGVWDGGIGLVAIYDTFLSADQMLYLSKP